MPIDAPPAAASPPLAGFHPAVADWFAATYGAPTPAQAEAWPAIRAGADVLVAAPTGSGKTFAAFLAVIDDLVHEGAAGTLPDETRIVYVSPLKALSNDIHRNLEVPLAGIAAALRHSGLPAVEIRAWVRTGDTPAAERARAARRPPHIVVTTPESLYVLLTSRSGRAMLATTRAVIVDEIHALAPNKRGAHLALSLERLDALAGRQVVRIGLSATQKPVDEVARFLAGARGLRRRAAPCAIVDTGHVRDRDLALELPASPLQAVMSAEVWTQVHARLAELAHRHRTTLVFVNTRRLAERLARHLSERVGAGLVASHHGSMARAQRLDAEQRLKRGELKVLVATASLELGIDIGDVDLVCQIGSPRSIASFLQRVGRSGHAVGATPRGRLFPLSRDDLVECAALLDAVARGELDRLRIPAAPLDVLAQQIVAEVSQREWREDDLFALVRRAHPFRALSRARFDAVVRMLAEGFHTRLGRRGAHLHRDAVNGVLRPRRGGGLAAVTSGGTIPDTADYSVVLEPEAQVVGTVNEDFAVESIAGDVFQLGNTAYRILRVERGTVRVEDARGAPPGIPFWLGEAPGRTAELSASVMALHAEVAAARTQGALDAVRGRLAARAGIGPVAAAQIVDYLAAAGAALGALPDGHTVVLERFFDESGGMQLVLHSSFGSRINRAWGLALRKRFCRKFNFELQAAATEDAIVLSLSTSHSFELADVGRYLSSRSVRPLLVQAVLDAPMFATRWRWNATVALALLRTRGGRRVAPQLVRMQGEDLLATVFPDQVACGENIVGDREVPDHPLVAQTLTDCLTEAMDIDGLERVLAAVEQGTIRVVAKDLTTPSPLALEVLAAKPYAFLDDAPLEERRTQAVLARRWLDPAEAADLGRLDEEAIVRIRDEVWPAAGSPDELHDALVGAGFLTDAEIASGPGWRGHLAALAAAGRATSVVPAGGTALWCATERVPELRAVHPGATVRPAVVVPPGFEAPGLERDTALREVIRDRMAVSGPVTAGIVATAAGLTPAEVEAVLARLEAEGAVLRGRFSPGVTGAEWCDRRVLARIHRATVHRLRQEIEPVEVRDFIRFLLRWQHVDAAGRQEGPDAVAAVLAQLEGFEAPAAAWEAEILPARVAGYAPGWLDELCRSGRVGWVRLSLPGGGTGRMAAPVRTTPIALVPRRHLADWLALAGGAETGAAPLSAAATAVRDALAVHGASFLDDLRHATRLLPAQLEAALAELVARGLATADGFAGLRALLLPADRRRSAGTHHRRRRAAVFGVEDGGRWSLVRRPAPAAGDHPGDEAAVEHVARVLLGRYGVVFWRLLAREAGWLPPWRDLLRCLRRLEARGEIRGGRFVAGITGEQFALPGAVGALREIRREGPSAELAGVSGADPLNLVGILTPGARLPALAGNRLLYRGGVPVARLAAGEAKVLVPADPAADWALEKALVRRGTVEEASPAAFE